MTKFTIEMILAAQEAFDPSNRRDFPAMPASEVEWHCHCAFYRLTISQRDRAWQNEAALKEEVQDLRREIAERDQEINDLQAELDEQERTY
jgi:hypothetical protein